MSPQTIGTSVLRTVPLLQTGQPLRGAVEAVIAAGVPALPVVDGPGGRLRGIFGEREFLIAIFPGYLDTLGYAAFVPRALDRVLEQRADCAEMPVGRWMTTDHVDVGPDVSDTGLAETFLHHRVLIVPVVDGGQVVGVVTRADFFRALGERFAGLV